MKNRSIIIYVASVLFLFTVSWIISCAVNPVTGQRELMLMTEMDEINLGKQTDQQIIETYGIYNDAELTAYIDNLGQKMGKITHRPQLNYEFKVLDTDVINAFAVPGGFVYFTRGILAYLNNEAEFAGVLGHELGHVNARHSANQYSKQQLMQLGLGVGMMFSETFRKYAGIAQFGVGMLFLKYSRDNERQADDLGVEYSMKTGYDANAMADFFNTLERMSGGSGQNGLPDWFSTHPNPVNRISAVRNKTNQWKQKLPDEKFAYNTNNYLAQVDGIMYGSDPRQGYVDGNAFYHPDLKFTFPVPEGWQVQNTPSQVQMVSPQQDAVIVFTLDNSATPKAASENFAQKSSAAVINTKSLTVNRMAAQQLISEVPSQSDTMQVMSHFIKKGDNVFVFHGFSSPVNYNQYKSSFEGTAKKFNNLTDKSKINVHPQKLVVKKATKAGSLESILKSFNIASDQLEATALLNGKMLNDQIKTGTMIKMVQN